MNNKWNRIIYRIWAPFYDRVFNSGVFLKARSKVFDELPITQDQHILFVGVGTGADLDFFSTSGVKITAIDISVPMLALARARVTAEMDISFV